jgi:hypothetical protein
MRTWTVLMALTAGSMFAGAVHPSAAHEPLGLVGVGLVLAAALFKSRQILLDFLGLRVAGGGWRALLYAWLVLIAALVLGAYAVALSGVLAR